MLVMVWVQVKDSLMGQQEVEDGDLHNIYTLCVLET
jgi:hypothetical protein